MPRPLKPELVWQDLGDNTGGLITINNIGDGVFEVFVSKFYGATDRSFVQIGSLGGTQTSLYYSSQSGPIDIIAFDSANGYSCDPIRARVTDGQAPLHQRCAETLRDFVIQLNLLQLPADPALHMIVKLGAKLEKALQEGIQSANQPPACVFYIPQACKIVVFDNQYDTITYPVIIAYLCKRGHEMMAGLTETLDYREKVYRAINACNMLDISEVHTTQVNPGVISDVGRWMDGYDASIMTVNFISEQQTGGLNE